VVNTEAFGVHTVQSICYISTVMLLLLHVFATEMSRAAVHRTHDNAVRNGDSAVNYACKQDYSQKAAYVHVY
jgi:hypothetical protein